MIERVPLPSYDQFLTVEGPELDRAFFASTRRQPASADVAHLSWRRLRENWTHDNILRDLQGLPPVDLVLDVLPWDGTPSYDDLVGPFMAALSATFQRVHNRKPSPADVRHNCWRFLVEGWTLDNALKDIAGEPNEGPTIPQPQPAADRPVRQRRGIVRAAGSALEDEDGRFLAVGASFFAALWAFRNDRDRLEQNLAWLAGQVDYIRVFAVVGPSGGWDDRTVNPHMPDFAADAAALTDLVYDRYGMRIAWTVFAGVDLLPTLQSRRDVVIALATAMAGREHKVIHWEVANEAWQNGFEGADGNRQLWDLGAILRQRTPNLVALSAANSEAQYTDLYRGSPASLATVHPDRSQKGTGELWRPVRQPWEIHFIDGLPAVRSVNEPIGPQSSVAQDDDPLRLTMLATVGWVTGSALFVLHTGPGVRFGGVEDRKKGRVADFWAVQNIGQILHGLRTMADTLPADVPSWSKHNGNEKFPDYPFDVHELTEDRILRAYVAIGGGRFVAAPIQVMKDTTFRARRSMQVAVVVPLSGEVIEDQALQPGEALVLPGDAANPKAYLLLGHFR